MKRLSALLLCCLFVFGCLNITSFASDVNESIVYFDDGSYLVTIITESTTARATKTKSGTKDLTYYDSNDNLEWRITLTGSFSYTGSSATCTSSSISYDILETSWKIPTALSSKIENKAIGDIVAKYYVLGIPTKTVTKT